MTKRVAFIGTIKGTIEIEDLFEIQPPPTPDPDPGPGEQAPEVQTNSATDVNQTSATLRGTILSLGSQTAGDPVMTLRGYPISGTVGSTGGDTPQRTATGFQNDYTWYHAPNMRAYPTCVLSNTLRTGGLPFRDYLPFSIDVNMTMGRGHHGSVWWHVGSNFDGEPVGATHYEIDLCEYVVDGSNLAAGLFVSQGTHSTVPADDGGDYAFGITTQVWRNHAIAEEGNDLVWRVDGVETYRTPKAPWLDVNMMLVIGFEIGGGWPGPPVDDLPKGQPADPTTGTPWPAEMRLRNMVMGGVPISFDGQYGQVYEPQSADAAPWTGQNLAEYWNAAWPFGYNRISPYGFGERRLFGNSTREAVCGNNWYGNTLENSPGNKTITQALIEDGWPNPSVIQLSNLVDVVSLFQYRVVGATEWTETAPVERTATGLFTASVTTLTDNTDYEVRAVLAYGDGQRVYGQTLTFATAEFPVAPDLTREEELLSLSPRAVWRVNGPENELTDLVAARHGTVVTGSTTRGITPLTEGDVPARAFNGNARAEVPHNAAFWTGASAAIYVEFMVRFGSAWDCLFSTHATDGWGTAGALEMTVRGDRAIRVQVRNDVGAGMTNIFIPGLDEAVGKIEDAKPYRLLFQVDEVNNQMWAWLAYNDGTSVVVEEYGPTTIAQGLTSTSPVLIGARIGSSNLNGALSWVGVFPVLDAGQRETLLGGAPA